MHVVMVRVNSVVLAPHPRRRPADAGTNPAFRNDVFNPLIARGDQLFGQVRSVEAGSDIAVKVSSADDAGFVRIVIRLARRVRGIADAAVRLLVTVRPLRIDLFAQSLE